MPLFLCVRLLLHGLMCARCTYICAFCAWNFQTIIETLKLGKDITGIII